MRGRRIRGIRPEEKESSLLTQHCISFFCYHKGELSFLADGVGEGDLFWGNELQSSFPDNERGEFCKRDEYCGRSLVFIFRSC